MWPTHKRIFCGSWPQALYIAPHTSNIILCIRAQTHENLAYMKSFQIMLHWHAISRHTTSRAVFCGVLTLYEWHVKTARHAMLGSGLVGLARKQSLFQLWWWQTFSRDPGDRWRRRDGILRGISLLIDWVQPSCPRTLSLIIINCYETIELQ